MCVYFAIHIDNDVVLWNEIDKTEMPNFDTLPINPLIHAHTHKYFEIFNAYMFR